MVQHARGLCLVLESPQPIRILRVLREKDLDGHMAAQPGVERSPDLTHAAGADERDQLVRAEALAGGRARSAIGECPGRHLQCARFQEAIVRPVRAQQRLDLRTQLRVPRARWSRKLDRSVRS